MYNNPADGSRFQTEIEIAISPQWFEQLPQNLPQ